MGGFAAPIIGGLASALFSSAMQPEKPAQSASPAKVDAPASQAERTPDQAAVRQSNNGGGGIAPPSDQTLLAGPTGVDLKADQVGKNKLGTNTMLAG
jgi:hypothetical protein